MRKSAAIKVAEACLKFAGFLGLNFMKWVTFVLGKMIKRYKKAFTPTLQTEDKFKIFGFLIKMLVCKGCSSKFMASDRVKFILCGYELISALLIFLRKFNYKNKNASLVWQVPMF